MNNPGVWPSDFWMGNGETCFESFLIFSDPYNSLPKKVSLATPISVPLEEMKLYGNEWPLHFE